MGYIFRFFVCRSCGKTQRVRQRQKARQCSCGNIEFKTRPNWYIRVNTQAGWYQQKVGPEALSLKVLRIKEGEIATGKFRIHKAKRILIREFALGDYWNLYAKDLKSARDYWNRMHRIILPEWGELYLHNVTGRDILVWLERMRRAHAPATVLKEFNVVKGFFTQAQKLKLIEENPAKEIEIKRPDNQRRDFLTTEEYHRLLDAAGNEMLRTAIIISVGTGMRAGELFAMEWCWCDFERREITVPAEVAKSSRSRLIPMIEPVYQALQNVPHRSLTSQIVLTNPQLGKPYVQKMRAALEAAVKRAGLPAHYGWHIIGRHTFASWWMEDGGGIYILQKVLGHESIKTTERYAHLAPQKKAREADKISHRFSVNGTYMGTFNDVKNQKQ